MPARRLLIVYGTSYGQTARSSRRMADVRTASGDTVTVVDADALPQGLALRDFDGVIVGASVLFGRHQHCVRRFVRAHRDALNAISSAFFSVSGSAASTVEAERARARQFIDEFLRTTGWLPALTESIAGAVAYTKYSPLLRWIAKRASQETGGPTDTSRDHKYTDWAQVQRFAETFTETRWRRRTARARWSRPEAPVAPGAGRELAAQEV